MHSVTIRFKTDYVQWLCRQDQIIRACRQCSNDLPHTLLASRWSGSGYLWRKRSKWVAVESHMYCWMFLVFHRVNDSSLVCLWLRWPCLGWLSSLPFFVVSIFHGICIIDFARLWFHFIVSGFGSIFHRRRGFRLTVLNVHGMLWKHLQ